MKTPGIMLREARESRGLSLGDVAAMTRIPKTMLEHLERDRFDEYVAEVFVRGHIRNYARELRIDSEEVLRAYERFTGKLRSESPESRTSTTGRVAVVRARMAEEGEGQALPSAGDSPRTRRILAGIRLSHMVAVVLVLFGLFVMVSFLTGGRATAKDPVAFPQPTEKAWELEQNIEQTRWLLEQPATAPDKDAESPMQP